MMKKIAVTVVSLIILFSTAIIAFADLGEPQFDDWYVYCAKEGLVGTQMLYDNDGPKGSVDVSILIGSKFEVFYYFEEKYALFLFPSEDSDYNNSDGYGYISVKVTDAEFAKYFIEENETVGGNVGTKLEEAVTCKVTPEVGLFLRQGPSTKFPSYTKIPCDTELTYLYVYKSGNKTWGLVDYNGQSGWACINYTEPVGIPETTVEETTSEAVTTKATQTEAAVTEKISSTDGKATIIDGESSEDKQNSQGIFLSTTAVIIICCSGAFIVAVTSIVTLLIVSKKKAGIVATAANNEQTPDTAPADEQTADTAPSDETTEDIEISEVSDNQTEDEDKSENEDKQ